MLQLAAIAASGALSPAAPDIASLARRGRALALDRGSTSDPKFDSIYTKEGAPRAWANWLIDDRLMLGQYPHCQPAQPGPSAADAEAHLRRVLESSVDCFTCLQAELPPQDDDAAWPADGGVPLPEAADRARWPEPFVRYAPAADALASELGRAAPPRYLHCPIVDLSVPRDGLAKGASLLHLLDAMLRHYEEGGRAIYVHCWGGRGRAGLVGACLLSLVRPDLDAERVLQRVQAGYDSRVGAGAMAAALKRSPQTEEQRQFVRAFVRAVRAARRFDGDVAMADGGMPRGFM